MSHFCGFTRGACLTPLQADRLLEAAQKSSLKSVCICCRKDQDRFCMFPTTQRTKPQKLDCGVTIRVPASIPVAIALKGSGDSSEINQFVYAELVRAFKADLASFTKLAGVFEAFLMVQSPLASRNHVLMRDFCSNSAFLITPSSLPTTTFTLRWWLSGMTHLDARIQAKQSASDLVCGSPFPWSSL